MHTLTARSLITDVGIIAYPAITVGPTGLIEDISSDPHIRSEAILTPTFLDVHIHGAAGQDVMATTPEGMSQLGRFLASRGTGHYLPTTVTAPVDDTLRALEFLAAAIERPASPTEAQPIGIHLEGPFLSHSKRGAHPAELLQQPSIALFERFQQAARGHIQLLTLAPETPGALDLIRHATAQGVRISVGHTNATTHETEQAIAAGATTATHTFNAMRPLDHREPGVLGSILDAQNLYAELICDGIHVAPTLVRLWLRLKQDHAILVTDAMSATGMPDGHYHLGSLAVTVEAGRCSLTSNPETLAGSVLTLDRAIANLMQFTGCTLETAIACATANPAAMLGRAGTLCSPRVGQPANFNQYTPAGHLEATWLHGQRLQ